MSVPQSRWTDADLDRVARVEEEHVAIVGELWRRDVRAPYDALLDAKEDRGDVGRVPRVSSPTTPRRRA